MAQRIDTFMIGGMTKQSQHLIIGPMRLAWIGDKLYVHHAATKEPTQVSADQLRRWLMKQIRDSIK